MALVGLIGLVAGCLLAACSAAGSTPSVLPSTDIKASDTACLVVASSFSSGTQTFAVSNAGSEATEVLIYAPGDRVVAEVENIGPSTSKRLTVALKPGHYEVTCRPGMAGNEIRAPITVKGPSGPPPTTSPELDAAVAGYRRYVVAQARLLQSRTRPFVAAVEAGGIAKAKSLYAAAHIPYGTITPIAAALGDLDPRIDARIDDVENGQEWTGFHRLEHDLWATGKLSKDSSRVAAQLTSDIAALVDETQRVELSADEIASAARSLTTGVSATMVKGDEERYSRLDLVDASAGVDGSEVAYLALRPIVRLKQPKLVIKLDTRYRTLKKNLAQYGSGASFQPYEALSKAEIHSLDDDVAALAAPLSQLSEAVHQE